MDLPDALARTRQTDMPQRKLATESSNLGRPNAPEKSSPPAARTARDKSGSRSNGRARSGSASRSASQAIKLSCATEVLAALLHAGHVGLAPNRHMTINLTAAGIDDPVGAIGHLMKLMKDGARRHGHALSYIWVREVGHVVGEHVHVLVHVPPALKHWFARRKPGWLKRIGASRKRGISCTRIIRGAPTSTHVKVASPELFSANLRNVTHYVLKHCSTDVQRHLGIISTGPCPLLGKRVSIWSRPSTWCNLVGGLGSSSGGFGGDV